LGPLPQPQNLNHLQQAMAFHQQALGQHLQNIPQARPTQQAQSASQTPTLPLSRQSSGTTLNQSHGTRNQPASEQNTAEGGNPPAHPRQAGPGTHPVSVDYSPDGTINGFSTAGVTPQGQRYAVTVRQGHVQTAVPQPGMAMLPPLAPQGLQFPMPMAMPNQFIGANYPVMPLPGQPDQGPNSRRATPGPGGPLATPSPFALPRPITPFRFGTDEIILRQAEAIAQEATRQPQAPSSNTQSTENPSPLSNRAAILPTPQIYALTDASGQPHALLVGPSGSYVSQPVPGDIIATLAGSGLPVDDLNRTFRSFLAAVWQSTANRIVDAHNTHMHHTHRINSRRVSPTQSNPLQPQNTAANPNIMDPVLNNGAAQPPIPAQQPAGAQQAPQPREPDEMRDLLAPIVRNLWLLIRIATLLYFVAGGGRAIARPLIVFSIFLIIWAVQAGHFGDILGDRIDWVRRYLNRIIGVDPGPDRRAAAPPVPADPPAPNQQPQAHVEPNGNAAQNVNADVVAHTRPSPPPPRPEDTAQRLVQDRWAQDAGWLAQQIHALERTVALFLASFWPGVGERAVRLQVERDLRREAEEAERREAAARLEAEREAAEQQGESQTNVGNEEGSNDAGADRTTDGARASGVDRGEGSSTGASGLERVNRARQSEAGDTHTGRDE
jgi:hypothetical protein